MISALLLFSSDKIEDICLDLDSYKIVDNTAIYFEDKQLIRIYLLKQDIIYIVIRGTSTTSEFYHDIQIVQTDFGEGRVHTGFYLIYNKIKDDVFHILKRLLTQTTKIYIIGHSLGGALGILLSYDLYRQYNNDILLYTLATPYCINKDISNVLKNITIYRIENEYDELCRFFTNSIVHSGIIDTYWKPGSLIIFKENIGFMQNHDLITYFNNIQKYMITSYID